MRLIECCVAGLVLSATLASGQTIKPGTASAKPGAASATARDRDALTQLEKDWNQAVMRRDMNFLEGLYAEDFLSTCSIGGKMTDRAQDLAEVKDAKNKVEAVELSDIKVRVFGTTAIVTGVNSTKGTSVEGMAYAPIRFTDVFMKRNGKWQVISSAATRISDAHK